MNKRQELIDRYMNELELRNPFKYVNPNRDYEILSELIDEVLNEAAEKAVVKYQDPKPFTPTKIIVDKQSILKSLDDDN